MAVIGAALPTDEAIAVPDQGHPMAGKLPKLRMSFNYIRWFSNLRLDVDKRPARESGQVRLTTQTASIAITPIPIGSVVSGLWRVSLHVIVTRAAAVSSEITGTITWTQGGITQTQSTALLNGNTTTTRESITVLLEPDAGTAISYSTTYASVGAPSMQYSLRVVAELVERTEA